MLKYKLRNCGVKDVRVGMKARELVKAHTQHILIRMTESECYHIFLLLIYTLLLLLLGLFSSLRKSPLRSSYPYRPFISDGHFHLNNNNCNRNQKSNSIRVRDKLCDT